MKYLFTFSMQTLLLLTLLFSSHCQQQQCKKDENNCFPIACSKMHFNPPVEYEKVNYNDYWSKWSQNDNCIDSDSSVDWKGFYCHKEDTFKKLYLSFFKDRISKKPSWPDYTSDDLDRRLIYIPSLMRENLSKKTYFDAEIDKNKDSLLISEVVGRKRLAWRYKIYDEFNTNEYAEPIDSMYHFEMTIDGRVFFAYDVARDTIFPTEEYRQEAIKIWNLIEFDE